MKVMNKYSYLLCSEYHICFIVKGKLKKETNQFSDK
jgi:hypothetical protein